MKGDQIAKHMSSISNYNQQAVEISKRVHAERQLGNRKALNHERSIEEKFPRDYRPGFGVAMEYQKMGLISFVHIEKTNNFCFMRKSMAQKLSLPRPLEN